MKKITATLFILALFISAYSQELTVNSKTVTIVSLDAAIFNWFATTVDFGKIKKGVPVSNEFSFTNDGNVPLVVTSVQASCGCTVTEYSREPIAPGAKGYVKATYNAAKLGVFTKTVTVNANTEEGVVQLTIKGEVIE